MDGNQFGTNGETFLKVMGQKLQQKNLWDQNCNKKKLCDRIGPLPKLWDQKCILAYIFQGFDFFLSFRYHESF